MTTETNCASCKHHSIEKRDFARQVLDPVRKLNVYDENEADVYKCRAQKNLEMGIVRHDEDLTAEERGQVPGAGCPLHEEGSKGLNNPELERLLALSAERANKDERRGQ